MKVRKYLPNETCPRCGSTGKPGRIQQKMYASKMSKRKFVARIDRCPDCTEAFGTVTKYQSYREC